MSEPAMNDQPVGSNPCWCCGGEYGKHDESCSILQEQQDRLRRPRRFQVRVPTGKKHPNGSTARFISGCYFPLTDLVVGDMGGRGTGTPIDVEWLDTE